MLSILMPVYNERATLIAAVKDVLSVEYPCEIELVIVDDGSTDGTRELYAEIEANAASGSICSRRIRARGPRSRRPPNLPGATT